jgi:hypothetical protein
MGLRLGRRGLWGLGVGADWQGTAKDGEKTQQASEEQGRAAGH